MSADEVRSVLLAQPRGFCAGVDRAIEIVRVALNKHGPPVYVRKEIVHNPYVVADLRAQGAIFVDSEMEVPEGSVVVLSAHGVPPSVWGNVSRRGLRAIDATCPLVTKVHLEAKKYVKDGYTVLLIGHAGHEEIVGTMGEAPEAICLLEDVRSAETVEVPNQQRLVCLTQTTLSLDDTREIVAVLQRRFPSLVVRNDICYATQNRQIAVKELAKRAGLILVVGASNSSNSVRLMEVARAQGVAAYRVNDVSDIQLSWVEGVKTVGVTSGASTPEVKVAEVVSFLNALGLGTVRDLRVLEENVTFALPKELQE